MGIVRTFPGLVPPARVDSDEPWTEATIAESVDGIEWEVVEEITLDPVDEDATKPTPRNLETDSATLTTAFYRVGWLDGSGDTSDGPIFYFDDDGAEAWARPTVIEVASYIRARTKVAGGIELGTFTDPDDVKGATRPTAAEVELLITQAVDHVSSSVGIEPCNGQLRRDARAASALYAAILVEVSYFPETSSNSGSSAVRLEALFNGRIKVLSAAVNATCGGGEGDAPGAGQLAAGHFADGRYLVGPDYPAAW